MANKNASSLTLVGKSDFQVLATAIVRDVKTIRCYGIDDQAMSRFEKNMQVYDFEFIPCSSSQEAVQSAYIIIVCTTCKAHAVVIENDWIGPGVHINALGGDCPGKTELDKNILSRAKVIVEFFDQSFIEGEIQCFY